MFMSAEEVIDLMHRWIATKWLLIWCVCVCVCVYIYKRHSIPLDQSFCQVVHYYQQHFECINLCLDNIPKGKYIIKIHWLDTSVIFTYHKHLLEVEYVTYFMALLLKQYTHTHTHTHTLTHTHTHWHTHTRTHTHTHTHTLTHMHTHIHTHTPTHTHTCMHTHIHTHKHTHTHTHTCVLCRMRTFPFIFVVTGIFKYAATSLKLEIRLHAH